MNSSSRIQPNDAISMAGVWTLIWYPLYQAPNVSSSIAEGNQMSGRNNTEKTVTYHMLRPMCQARRHAVATNASDKARETSSATERLMV